LDEAALDDEFGILVAAVEGESGGWGGAVRQDSDAVVDRFDGLSHLGKKLR